MKNKSKSTLKVIMGLVWMSFLPLLAFSQSHSKPNSNVRKDDRHKVVLYNKILHTTQSDSVLIYLNAFLQKYPEALSEFMYRPDAIYGNVAERMASDKKWDQYEIYHAKMSAAEGSHLDYVMAGDLLKSHEELPLAERLALRSLQEYEKIHRSDLSTEVNPDSIATKGQYIRLASLYAELAYVNKHEAQGLPYAWKASRMKGGNESREYELYLKLLAKNAEPSVAISAIEAHYRSGNVNDDEMPSIVANLYAQIHPSSENFEAYYRSLNDEWLAVTKSRISKKKIAEAAPDFTLLNLNGEKVKLSDMKGKTVVIDFWATWCSFCKMAFPGMQKMIEKYKSNDKVVFLFIDTQESLSDVQRKENITKYLTSNKYRFQVLLDTEKANNYEVVTAFKVEGLPAKFVIDQNGNIAFKEVGYSGSEERLINDLSAMIDLTL